MHLPGHKTPFSSAERRHALTQAYALCQRFGLPSWFFTFAPDTLHNSLTVRLHFASFDNQSWPATHSQGYTDSVTSQGVFEFRVPSGSLNFSEAFLQKLNAGNAAAASQVYKRVLELVFEYLLGVPPEYLKRKSHWRRQAFSVFGKPKAVFAVTEVQSRLALHCHLLFFGGLTPLVLQRCSTVPELRDLVLRVLGSYCKTTLPASAHVRHLLRKLDDKEPPRAERFPSHQQHSLRPGVRLPLRLHTARSVSPSLCHHQAR